MKKIIVSAALFFIVFISHAQTTRFGLTGGITIASMKAKSSGISFTTDSKVGFTFGVLADVTLKPHFMLQPGLNFTQKGLKVNLNFDTDKVNSKETLNYIELPVNLLYHITAGKGKFFGGAGPVFSYGIGGKSESTITTGGQTTTDSHTVKFGSNADGDDYKPFEVAGNIIAGYELNNGLFFSASYNFGISNIAVDNNSGKVHNRYFGLRLGYKLSAGK